MNDILDAYHFGAMLARLHETWTPHPGQIPIGRALFYENCKNIFVQCGRNWGKTEFAKYAAVRWALSHPGSENYIFEPFQKQAREILWESGRLWEGLPKEWIDGKPNDTELRLTFANGSFIKLDGTDNREAIAGYKPRGLIVYDEFKDHDKRAIDVFEPNRAAFGVPALFIGTPPDVQNHFVDLGNFAKTSKKWRYFHGPTSQNPHISKEWLDDKKAELIARGELETWLREYEAIFVIGGKNSVFPMANKLTPKKFSSIRPADLNHWQAFIIMDPGSSSVFAVKINLWNPYQRRVIWFKELYLTTMAEMTTDNVWTTLEPILQALREMQIKDIEFHYDEAAKWFSNESAVHPIGKKYSLWPTQKASHPKDYGISTIRTMMAQGNIECTEDVPKSIWEFQNYVLDDKGKIPKKNDHLIDCERYFCAAVGLDLNETSPPKLIDKDLEPRGFSIHDDFRPDPYRDFDHSDLTNNSDFFEEY